jgi:hypothetical protein
MLKIENGRSLSRARELLRGLLKEMAEHEEYKSITISTDVDAQ